MEGFWGGWEGWDAWHLVPLVGWLLFDRRELGGGCGVEIWICG
jgi:hypothetical protein